MKRKMRIKRRDFLKRTGQGAMAVTALGALGGFSPVTTSLTMKKSPQRPGTQRLSLAKLKEWEDWGYGMFIHFGLSTFVERKSQRVENPISAYNPDKLDVDQWISVARDAGMKYVVLTAKSESYGHCLWPSEHTDNTVANSPNQTDVVEKLVQACQKRGIKPGLYYNSSDS